MPIMTSVARPGFFMFLPQKYRSGVCSTIPDKMLLATGCHTKISDILEVMQGEGCHWSAAR